MRHYWHVFYITVIAIVGGFFVWFFLELQGLKPTPLGENEMQRFQTALLNKTKNFSEIKWLGKKIWQPLPDLWTLQETIFEVKPELLIECGTYRGGSSYFFAQLFDLMGHGRVITVDIKKLHNLSHPRVTYLIGDSVSPEIVDRIRSEVNSVKGPVMVVLDSDHSQRHVSKELEAYHRFVTPGSFIHVQDGVIDILPLYHDARPGPLRAIEEFIRTHSEFQVDEERSARFLITHHPKGWLRRRRDASK